MLNIKKDKDEIIVSLFSSIESLEDISLSLTNTREKQELQETLVFLRELKDAF